MDGRIGHLHCRYRVLGGPDVAPGLAARLDRIAHEHVPESWTEALAGTLEDDETVYVLRHVRAGLALDVHGEPSDLQLGQRWAREIASSVLHTIADHPSDGLNLVRFDDRADYVAHFVVDLLNGRAWERWFYGAFSSVRTLPLGDALRTVLLDHRDCLSAVLANLNRQRALPQMLSALDPQTIRLLWSYGIRGMDEEAMPAAVRPLFAAAIEIGQRLGSWSMSGNEGETLLPSYLSTQPPLPDWRDIRSLAQGVVHALRFLLAHTQGADGEMAAAGGLALRLRTALAGFDWLDSEWLETALGELFEAPLRIQSDAPTRPASAGPTARQRLLLADVQAALARADIDLTSAALRSPATALQLYAILVEHAPRWRDDPAASSFIERLLWASDALAGEPAELQALRRRLRGEPGASPEALAAVAPEEVRRATAFIKRLGADGLQVVDRLAQSVGPPDVRSNGVVSACAGIFLLVRAVLDIRLSLLVERARYPRCEPDSRLPALLMAVGLAWAGEAGLRDGRLDKAISLLAGVDEEVNLEDLRALWSETRRADHARFRRSLREAMAQQRMPPDAMFQLRRPRSAGDPAAFEVGRLGADVDLTIQLAAASLMRLWARWLRGFDTSSIPYLCTSFIRRPGRVYQEKGLLVVELDPRPLDLVLNMAGYTSDIPEVPWLGRRIRFRMGGP